MRGVFISDITLSIFYIYLAEMSVFIHHQTSKNVEFHLLGWTFFPSTCTKGFDRCLLAQGGTS